MSLPDVFKNIQKPTPDQPVTPPEPRTPPPSPSAVRRINNIEAFKDTLQIIKQDPLLSSRTARSAQETVLILPETFSEKTPVSKETNVHVQEATTLQAARELCGKYRRVALLNFANPIEPGGGVWRGANAQEESLCRAGTLYPCLTGNGAAGYYRDHQTLPRNGSAFWGSDRVLYSPGITFFKEEVPADPGSDTSALELRYTDDWFTADVITCAAPFFPSRQAAAPWEKLHPVLVERIKNILEAAIDHDVEALVLGAFGCGAFNNPPMTVAEAFQFVLLQPRYLNAFDEICFAIKPSDKTFCPNLSAFQLKFFAFPDASFFTEEGNTRRFFE